MRVFLTGASGFVGRWLVRELENADHVVVGRSERVDVTDSEAVRHALAAATPDGVVHLAAVSFAPDAAADPERAYEVNVRGTLNVVEAVRREHPHAAVVVAGSSEVYREPDGADPVLREDSLLGPRNLYGLSKAAAEGVAVGTAARHGLRLAVTRAFNHIGPEQREVFVVPAIARRLRNVLDGQADDVPIGNLNVRRDFTDVRDVVRAYRLVLEALHSGTVAGGGVVLNVASGRSTSIGEIVTLLSGIAGIEPAVRVDPQLVRPGEAREIVGDPSRLRQLTGWQPDTSIATTLTDIWTHIALKRSPANV